MNLPGIRSNKKWRLAFMLLLASLLLLSACSPKKTDSSDGKPSLGEASYPVTLRIVSGSEN